MTDRLTGYYDKTGIAGIELMEHDIIVVSGVQSETAKSVW